MKGASVDAFQACRGRSQCVRVSALIGGGRGGPGMGGRGGPGGRGGGGSDRGGLILGPNTPRPGQKLIIPGTKPSGTRPQLGQKLVIADGNTKLPGMSGGVLTEEDTVTTLTGPGYYRPPAGFMNEEIDEDTTVDLSVEQMISKLQTRSGRWYDLAKYVVALHKQGIDAKLVDEMTGMNPVEQNLWAVGATVYFSLKADGKVSQEVLDSFDAPRGAGLLHPFRFLTNETDFRNAAAEYIFENNLDEQMCEILAREMKEYERRVDERHGFSTHPGDCLAFKYMRDANESKKPELVVMYCKKALSVAVTASAKARVNEVTAEMEEAISPTREVTASLLMLKFSVDEIGHRPVSLLGELGSVKLAALQSAPRTSQDGPFMSFSIPASSTCKWVVMPQWKALTVSRHPVALEISDISAVEAVCMGTKAKSDEDKKRLRGPGLLVVDRVPVTSGGVSIDKFYLAAINGSTTVSMVDGATLQRQGLPAAATVLFVCRPPVRDGVSNARGPEENLFQL